MRKVSFDGELPKPIGPEDDDENDRLIHNLRFGDGDLLKDFEGDAADMEHPGGRSLKGRYIIRVGWDDVRGWFTQVRHPGICNKGYC